MKKLLTICLIALLFAPSISFALGGTSGTGTGTSLTAGAGGSGASVSVTAGSTNIVINPSPGTGTFTVDTSASPTFATSVTTPLVIGGTGAASTLTLESTSGTGTTDAILFKTGSQTEAMRITTAGTVGIGTTTSTTTMTAYAPVQTNAVESVAKFVSAGNQSANLIFSALTPSMTAGNKAAYFVVGVANTTNNAGQFAFWYPGGTGSASNYMQLSLVGQAFGLNILSGTVGIGTNVAVSGSKLVSSGHIGYAPTDVPAVTSCGSGSLAVGSTDNKGQITGITAATACTITFSSALPAAPACAFSSSTGIAVGGVPSTSAVTTVMAALTGSLAYLCQ